jgi:hypothetical protein
MAEKPKSSIPAPAISFEGVLIALSSIVRPDETTLQLYTSKRGRTWVSIRDYGQAPYSTAMEVADKGNAGSIALALGGAAYIHARKRAGDLPRADTWSSLAVQQDGVEQLKNWLDAGELPAVVQDDEPG